MLIKRLKMERRATELNLRDALGYIALFRQESTAVMPFGDKGIDTQIRIIAPERINPKAVELIDLILEQMYPWITPKLFQSKIYGMFVEGDRLRLSTTTGAVEIDGKKVTMSDAVLNEVENILNTLNRQNGFEKHA